MKRSRPKSKGGLRIDVGDALLADPDIQAATIALVKLIAARAALTSPEGGTTIACARKGGSGMCVGVVAAHCPDCGGPPLEGGTTETECQSCHRRSNTVRFSVGAGDVCKFCEPKGGTTEGPG